MKKRILATAMILLFLATQFASAASVIVRHYEFQTSNPDYKNYTAENIGKGDMKDIPVTVKNGFFTVKRVTDIKISLLSEESPEEETYTGLQYKELPAEAKTYETKDGEKLKLVDVEWKEYNRTAATGTITKRGYEERPTFPNTKALTYTLDNGTVINTAGKLKSVKATGQSYSKDFSVTGKFIGDSDVDFYNFNGTLIENNPKSPAFEGYETTILRYFGLNPTRYKITSGAWTSDYIEEDGQTVRYAKFSGKQLVSDWTAYYEEEFDDGSSSIKLYEAKCYYGNQKDSIYNVKVTVEYGKTEIIVGRVVAVSVGILVAAGFTTFLLLFLAKKKKRNEEPTK